jgi:type II secretory pathway pseudopilin PulG
MMRTRGDVGETLVEVMLTIVIIGLTVTALLASLATVGNAGNSQRLNVQGDFVMRNYADAAKTAVTACATDPSYTVEYPVDRAPLPAGFKLPTGAGGLCPAAGTTTKLTLTVIGPLGFHDSMDIRVRTP